MSGQPGEAEPHNRAQHLDDDKDSPAKSNGGESLSYMTYQDMPYTLPLPAGVDKAA